MVATQWNTQSTAKHRISVVLVFEVRDIYIMYSDMKRCGSVVLRSLKSIPTGANQPPQSLLSVLFSFSSISILFSIILAAAQKKKKEEDMLDIVV
jgi:hypothetical protein